MTDETEVIVSSHIAEADSTDSSNSRSPFYTDTEVSGSQRTVRFWNTPRISDTSNGKERKFRAKITIEGHGVNISSGWSEFEYSSPVDPTPLSPDKSFDVPDDNLNQYNFDVKTVWELYEMLNGQYTLIDEGLEGPMTAIVVDNTSN